MKEPIPNTITSNTITDSTGNSQTKNDNNRLTYTVFYNNITNHYNIKNRNGTVIDTVRYCLLRDVT
jgi:hypothetical protein